MVQAAQATQKMTEQMQKQQEADYKAFMERFDTNHDGKISGKERGPAQKYLRQKDLGLDPDASLKKPKRTKPVRSPKPSTESIESKASEDAKDLNE
jgi:hypothetical protein